MLVGCGLLFESLTFGAYSGRRGSRDGRKRKSMITSSGCGCVSVLTTLSCPATQFNCTRWSSTMKAISPMIIWLATLAARVSPIVASPFLIADGNDVGTLASPRGHAPLPPASQSKLVLNLAGNSQNVFGGEVNKDFPEGWRDPRIGGGSMINVSCSPMSISTPLH